MQSLKYIFITLFIMLPVFAYASPSATTSNDDETGTIVPVLTVTNGDETGSFTPVNIGTNEDMARPIITVRVSGVRSSGLLYPCFYIHAFYSGSCENTPELIRFFREDRSFQDSIITQWRLAIFKY